MVDPIVRQKVHGHAARGSAGKRDRVDGAHRRSGRRRECRSCATASRQDREEQYSLSDDHRSSSRVSSNLARSASRAPRANGEATGSLASGAQMSQPSHRIRREPGSLAAPTPGTSVALCTMDVSRARPITERPQVNRTTRSFVTGVCGSSPAIGRGVHAPRDAPTDGDPVYAPTGPERRPARGTLAPRVRGLARVAFLFICSRPSLAACAGSMASDSPWELSVGGQVGVPRGYVQVRENQIRGTRLQLHRDLGIDTSESLTLGAAYHLTALDALRLTFDSVFLYGSSRLPTEVEFNGTTLRAGTDIDTRPEFFRLTALYERRLLALGRGAISRGTSASRMSFSPSNSTAPSLRARRTPTWARTSSPRSYRFLSWDSGSTGRSSIGSASSAR